APAAGAEACRKTMLEIVELDLDGLFRPLSLPHVRDSLPRAGYIGLTIPRKGRERVLGRRYTPSLRAQRSNPWRSRWRGGLLRCARNDGEAPYFITPFS